MTIGPRDIAGGAPEDDEQRASWAAQIVASRCDGDPGLARVVNAGPTGGRLLCSKGGAVRSRALAVLSAAVLAMLVLCPATADAQGTTTTVLTWGDFGEKWPVSPTISSPQPVTLPGVPSQMVTTNSATYALISGMVYAIGAGNDGELGIGDFSGYTMTPVQVMFPAGVDITSLASPGPFATELAIDSTGRAWGWGDNNGGELCLGNTRIYRKPVMLPFSDVTLVSGAGRHATYDAGGTLYACGRNSSGELGTGSPRSSKVPVPVALGGPVTALTSSDENTGALLADGDYYDWGLNSSGQLGDGTTANSDSPVEVLSGVSTVASGGSTANNGQSFATLSDGTTEAWGSDHSGQFCNGTTKRVVTSPVAIASPPGVTWTTWVTGGSTSYPIDSDGNLWVCGDNHNGEAGLGYVGGKVVPPTEILSGVSFASATSRNVLALVP
jgi:alpha-tubulin suppressor-like RCC1 family protein